MPLPPLTSIKPLQTMSSLYGVDLATSSITIQPEAGSSKQPKLISASESSDPCHKWWQAGGDHGEVDYPKQRLDEHPWPRQEDACKKRNDDNRLCSSSLQIESTRQKSPRWRCTRRV